jgi:hypothetical protein
MMAAVAVVAVGLWVPGWTMWLAWSYTWWQIKPWWDLVLLPCLALIVTHPRPPRSAIWSAALADLLLIFLWVVSWRPYPYATLDGRWGHPTSWWQDWFKGYMDFSWLVSLYSLSGGFVDLVCLSLALLLLAALLIRTPTVRLASAYLLVVVLLSIYDWTGLSRMYGTEPLIPFPEGPWASWWLATPALAIQGWFRGRLSGLEVCSQVGAVKALEFLAMIAVLAHLTGAMCAKPR